MNTLILTVSAGGGHNVTARAISEAIMAHESDSKIHISDAIKYISPVLDKMVIGTYLNSLKVTPRAYNLFYSTMDKADDPDPGSNPFIEKIEELAATRLLPLIREHEPDIILSTHAFTTQLVASLKLNGHIRIPALSIITDFGIHSSTLHDGMDGFIIAHEDLVPEMTRRGVPEGLILPFGIPVRDSFKETYDRKETLGFLDMDPQLPLVTLAGGTLGLGRMKAILKELDSIERNFNIAVISSSNQKFHDEAAEIARASKKNIAVMKYCNFMDALLYSTDLLVTKPGGLTVSEALVTGSPMAIFMAVGGQETQNRKFLAKNGLAIDIGNGTDCAEAIETLLFDENKLRAMADRTKAFAKPDAASRIFEHMAELIWKYKGIPEPVVLKAEQELDENALDKLKDFTDDFLDDLSKVPLFGSIMDKIRGYYEDADSDGYYELSDEELDQILKENRSSDRKILQNRSFRKFSGKLLLSRRNRNTEKEKTPSETADR